MNHQQKIPTYRWLVFYAIGFSAINGLLILNQIDSGAWLILMSIPPVILASLYPSIIYRASVVVFALNLFAARLIWPIRPFGMIDWIAYVGLCTVILVMELNGFLARRQRRLLSELEKTEAELRQQKSFLQLVLDSSPNLISVRNKHEEYVLANPALVKLLGKSSEEITGKKLNEIFTDEDMIARSMAENSKVFDTAEAQFIPERFISDKEGNPHWFQITKSPMRDASGDISHILIVADEITHQQLATQESQRNTQLFRALIECTAFLLEDDFDSALQKTLNALGTIIDIDCILVAENRGEGEQKSVILQEEHVWHRPQSPRDPSVKYPLEISFFPHLTRVYGIMSAGHMLRLEELTESEKSWLSARRTKSMIALPIQVDGKFWGSICFLDLVNEYQWLENECNALTVFASILGTAIARRNDWNDLAKQERFTRDVLSALPVNLFVKDVAGRFVMDYCKDTQSSSEIGQSVIGKTSLELFDEEEALKYSKEDKNIIRTGQTFLSQIEPFRNSKGEERWRQIEKSPIRDTDGNITHIVGIQYDLTDQVEKNEEFRKAKEAAEAATRAKSAFLANMSHEIRTPMNAVVGMASLLTQTGLDREQAEYVDTIRTSSETLLGVINKVLDFSKIESEQLELEQQTFNLIESLEQTIELFAHKAYEKGLELILSIAPGVPTHINGDSVRLRQVLSNLIDNGIKFTEVGEIVVSVARMQDDDQRLYFYVSDNGIGLGKDEQQRLFRSFSQVDTSITRRYGGTGLGLAISKRLCELMGGTIWVESVEGQGSTFNFSILIGTITDQPNWPSNQNSLNRKRILLIENNPRMRKELQNLLELWGASVTVANSVAQLSQQFSGLPYHLTIAELHMAQESGFIAALEGQKERMLSDVHLLLLCTIGDTLNLSALQEHFKCSTLTKPVKPSELLNCITTSIDARQQAELSRSNSLPLPPINASVRILLVEDNAVNRKVALRLLQRLGYQAEVAANGEEAVNLLLREYFDIVLMDAHMPVMGGLEATRRIRAVLPESNQPYIIGITADALASFREECLDAGMNDYITKPVGFDDLAKVLTRCIEKLAESKVIA